MASVCLRRLPPPPPHGLDRLPVPGRRMAHEESSSPPTTCSRTSTSPAAEPLVGAHGRGPRAGRSACPGRRGSSLAGDCRIDTRRCGRGRELQEATRADLEAFIADLLSSRSPATASARYKQLQALYRWLEDEEEIEVNPMTRMRPPMVSRSRSCPRTRCGGCWPPAPARASRPAGTPRSLPSCWTPAPAGEKGRNVDQTRPLAGQWRSAWRALRGRQTPAGCPPQASPVMRIAL